MENAAALRWNVKSVRSKRPRWPQDDEYAAATALLLLSESGGGFCSTTADPTISPAPKAHQEAPQPAAAAPSGLIIRIKRQRSDRCPNSPLPTPIYQEAPQPVAAAPSGLIIRIKRQESDRSPNSPLPTPIYPCSTCDKVFQCSQALGGHMRLHRAKKGKAAAAVVSEDHHHNSESARAHECSLCRETFGTGQALGGHMRKHFDKSKLAGKSAGGDSTSCSEVSYASTGGAGPMMMIDLNLPPLE
ncbi:zinc finger protein AZF2-like [Salvia divinorum]|uniref:Zinc finger protein AZF2-like n=1 Tax=Salvia divinorum TaxID=28513 RepID=A0ABD1HSK2_SALDI